jgi:hypothetical protein
MEIKRVFKVNGQPFYPIGGESCNSSGYNDRESETAFKVTKLLHGNTLLIPVYWEQIEPIEGTFDFTGVDALLAKARRDGIKLILLWFATWRTGFMDYVPAWVKTNPERFKRALDAQGKILWNLCSECKVNLKADSKAFTALCLYLKAKDSARQTVIALQVENEPWLTGSDRDYSPETQAVFDSIVPDTFMNAMQKFGKCSIYDIWRKAGGKKTGAWPELFGREAGKIMNTWSIARYIDGVAESGKAVYDIPMFINGINHQHLDVWKRATPHIDMIAPDIYTENSRIFENICAIHTREDNPLFVPESNADQYMFRAIADYNAIGYFFYGLEHLINPRDSSLRPDSQMVVDNIQATMAIAPLLLKYQGTGKIHAVIHEENLPSQRLDLEGYIGVVEFGDRTPTYMSKDWRHRTGSSTMPREQPGDNRGSGLVIQASRQEFYLVGTNYRLFLQPKTSFDQIHESRELIAGHFICVDEGHFNQQGEFIADRRRNGDELGRRGLWVETDIGVLRAITCD